MDYSENIIILRRSIKHILRSEHTTFDTSWDFLGCPPFRSPKNTVVPVLLNIGERKLPSTCTVINSLLMLIQNILEVQEINKKSLQSGWKTKRDFVTEFNNLTTGLLFQQDWSCRNKGATSSWNIKAHLSFGLGSSRGNSLILCRIDLFFSKILNKFPSAPSNTSFDNKLWSSNNNTALLDTKCQRQALYITCENVQMILISDKKVFKSRTVLNLSASTWSPESQMNIEM